MEEVLSLFFILLIGLAIGSFLNVCIYRIPRDESIIFPASRCITCGYNLKISDLVPIFSYIFLKGKCRCCKEKISIKYPIVELINASLYLIIFLKYGYTLEFLKYSVLASLLIVIALIDFNTKFVYRSTVMFGLISGIIFWIGECLITEKIIMNNILGALIGFTFIFLIVITTGGMGEGDIEIATICGLFLGVKGIIITLFLSIIIAGIIAISILLFKLKDKKDAIAFGPYLAIGAIISITFFNHIFQWYVSYLLQ